MTSKQILTFIANDQTGLVNKMADAVADAGGNWLESSMSHLAGKFAGIALVEIDPDNQEQLESNLAALQNSDLQVSLDSNYNEQPDEQERILEVEVVAHDRPGIVRELTSLLSSLNVNVESLHTNRTVAAMSSEHLFEASAVVVLPSSLDEEGLRQHLETLSDDLMVELFDLDDNDE
ncbi:ACT domain-containing protein [bacterium SCSIO 12696]|nr:ACT domain-containing protein [bacterium SCSIO 12696]